MTRVIVDRETRCVTHGAWMPPGERMVMFQLGHQLQIFRCEPCEDRVCRADKSYRRRRDADLDAQFERDVRAADRADLLDAPTGFAPLAVPSVLRSGVTQSHHRAKLRLVENVRIYDEGDGIF